MFPIECAKLGTLVISAVQLSHRETPEALCWHCALSPAVVGLLCPPCMPMESSQPHGHPTGIFVLARRLPLRPWARLCVNCHLDSELASGIF